MILDCTEAHSEAFGARIHCQLSCIARCSASLYVDIVASAFFGRRSRAVSLVVVAAAEVAGVRDNSIPHPT
jgi:hypothetical protein